MIMVTDTFVCKPGNASKLAKLFREWANLMQKEEVYNGTTYVMTDMTGQWHRVIMASTFKNVAEWEENFDKMPKSAKAKAMMKKFEKMNEMYVSGSREILKLW
jgi:hypothetical protein